MKEKLELVTDFATLRAGMIVVLKPCGWCNTSGHRFMLVKRRHGEMVRPNGEDITDDYWTTLPAFHQERDGTERSALVVSSYVIPERRVYRVVDGLEQSTETRKSVTA